LDCGACGAPSCKALAKDIVAGLARESDCLFVLKQLLATLYEQSTGGILPNR
jgi:Na+-translocating ferredoxin:NAD+ oxidoreductase RNF subunit RnfB